MTMPNRGTRDAEKYQQGFCAWLCAPRPQHRSWLCVAHFLKNIKHRHQVAIHLPFCAAAAASQETESPPRKKPANFAQRGIFIVGAQHQEKEEQKWLSECPFGMTNNSVLWLGMRRMKGLLSAGEIARTCASKCFKTGPRRVTCERRRLRLASAACVSRQRIFLCGSARALLISIAESMEKRDKNLWKSSCGTGKAITRRRPALQRSRTRPYYYYQATCRVSHFLVIGLIGDDPRGFLPHSFVRAGWRISIRWKESARMAQKEEK